MTRPMKEALMIVSLGGFAGVMLLGSALFAAGCTEPCEWKSLSYDTATYERVFSDCLKSLPKGPETVAAAGNDWGEVVSECRETARHISIHAAKAACLKTQGDRR